MTPARWPAWRPISTAPRDGTEFQAWVRFNLGHGGWEPRARFDPEYGRFEVWQRVDYDMDDWDLVHGEPTHWLPLPPAPEGGDG